MINCGHFQALIAENFGILAPENVKIKSVGSRIRSKTFRIELHHALYQLGHLFYTKLRIKKQKKCCGKDMFWNFLLNNHHPSNLKQRRKKCIKKLNLAGFEPAFPGSNTTSISTVQYYPLPNRQPFRQLITERFGIHNYGNRKSLFNHKQVCD